MREVTTTHGTTVVEQKHAPAAGRGSRRRATLSERHSQTEAKRWCIVEGNEELTEDVGADRLLIGLLQWETHSWHLESSRERRSG